VFTSHNSHELDVRVPTEERSAGGRGPTAEKLLSCTKLSRPTHR